MAHLSDLENKKTNTAIIVNSIRLTPNTTDEIREITLELNASGFQPKVNQSIGVLINHESEFGNSYHHRIYTIADMPNYLNDKVQLNILVKRCFDVDEFSGERHPGIASNYLCDSSIGSQVNITGPHELPFEVPNDKSTDLILVGMGTGIAPFKALVKTIYNEVKNWQGKIRLFYGAKSGLELLYLNDQDGDLTQYYDETTFKAFKAISPRPHMNDPIALDHAIEDRAAEILEMLNKLNTRIYVAGYKAIEEKLEKAFSNIMGSNEAWKTRKAELVAGNKWQEIIY
ncbi:MAG: ferredoxin-NADP reductase [Bacteroidia bacterium]